MSHSAPLLALRRPLVLCLRAGWVMLLVLGAAAASPLAELLGATELRHQVRHSLSAAGPLFSALCLFALQLRALELSRSLSSVEEAQEGLGGLRLVMDQHMALWRLVPWVTLPIGLGLLVALSRLMRLVHFGP